jgi:hypothetical protein
VFADAKSSHQQQQSHVSFSFFSSSFSRRTVGVLKYSIFSSNPPPPPGVVVDGVIDDALRRSMGPF